METLKILLTIIFVLVCIALCIVVMMQEGKNNGLGALAGGSSNDSYLDKNKNRTKNGMLLKITKILAILFILLATVLNLNFDRSSTDDSANDTNIEQSEETEDVTEAPTEEASATDDVSATEVAE